MSSYQNFCSNVGGDNSSLVQSLFTYLCRTSTCTCALTVVREHMGASRFFKSIFCLFYLHFFYTFFPHSTVLVSQEMNLGRDRYSLLKDQGTIRPLISHLSSKADDQTKNSCCFQLHWSQKRWRAADPTVCSGPQQTGALKRTLKVRFL